LAFNRSSATCRRQNANSTLDIASNTLPYVFTPLGLPPLHEDKETAKAFVRDIRARAERFGRDPRLIKIMPGVCPIVAGSRQEAWDKFATLNAFQDPAVALKVLADRLGHDLSGYDLDGPVPELPASDGMRGHAATLTAMAGLCGWVEQKTGVRWIAAEWQRYT
jgi:alkanesulfonate monooxygenase SsuD/methylene tetrahydromethanopterin reductase-like flavin-dependent oxidoreductase (luciferase family)